PSETPIDRRCHDAAPKQDPRARDAVVGLHSPADNTGRRVNARERPVYPEDDEPIGHQRRRLSDFEAEVDLPDSPAIDEGDRADAAPWANDKEHVVAGGGPRVIDVA